MGGKISKRATPVANLLLAQLVIRNPRISQQYLRLEVGWELNRGGGGTSVAIGSG